MNRFMKSFLIFSFVICSTAQILYAQGSGAPGTGGTPASGGTSFKLACEFHTVSRTPTGPSYNPDGHERDGEDTERNRAACPKASVADCPNKEDCEGVCVFTDGGSFLGWDFDDTCVCKYSGSLVPVCASVTKASSETHSVCAMLTAKLDDALTREAFYQTLSYSAKMNDLRLVAREITRLNEILIISGCSGEHNEEQFEVGRGTLLN